MKAKKSPYYTCVLQTSSKDDVGTQAIGFSNTKRNLKEIELNQTQVTITNASSEIDSSGKKKILINNFNCSWMHFANELQPFVLGSEIHRF